MTQAQFEARYARRCGCPTGIRARDWLREMCSLEAIPCDCGDAGCPGWRMVAIRGEWGRGSQVATFPTDGVKPWGDPKGGNDVG